jgi:hypothetical protein
MTDIQEERSLSLPQGLLAADPNNMSLPRGSLQVNRDDGSGEGPVTDEMLSNIHRRIEPLGVGVPTNESATSGSHSFKTATGFWVYANGVSSFLNTVENAINRPSFNPNVLPEYVTVTKGVEVSHTLLLSDAIGDGGSTRQRIVGALQSAVPTGEVNANQHAILNRYDQARTDFFGLNDDTVSLIRNQERDAVYKGVFDTGKFPYMDVPAPTYRLGYLTSGKTVFDAKDVMPEDTMLVDVRNDHFDLRILSRDTEHARNIIRHVPEGANAHEFITSRIDEASTKGRHVLPVSSGSYTVRLARLNGTTTLSVVDGFGGQLKLHFVIAYFGGPTDVTLMTTDYSRFRVPQESTGFHLILTTIVASGAFEMRPAKGYSHGRYFGDVMIGFGPEKYIQRFREGVDNSTGINFNYLGHFAFKDGRMTSKLSQLDDLRKPRIVSELNFDTALGVVQRYSVFNSDNGMPWLAELWALIGDWLLASGLKRGFTKTDKDLAQSNPFRTFRSFLNIGLPSNEHVSARWAQAELTKQMFYEMMTSRTNAKGEIILLGNKLAEMWPDKDPQVSMITAAAALSAMSSGSLKIEHGANTGHVESVRGAFRFDRLGFFHPPPVTLIRTFMPTTKTEKYLIQWNVWEPSPQIISRLEMDATFGMTFKAVLEAYAGGYRLLGRVEPAPVAKDHEKDEYVVMLPNGRAVCVDDPIEQARKVIPRDGAGLIDVGTVIIFIPGASYKSRKAWLWPYIRKSQLKSGEMSSADVNDKRSFTENFGLNRGYLASVASMTPKSL